MGFAITEANRSKCIEAFKDRCHPIDRDLEYEMGNSGAPLVRKGDLLWHYTVGLLLSQILDDALIKPATAFVLNPREHPVVWFSANPDWEATANKMWRNPDGTVEKLDREETHRCCGGLARIGVLPRVAPFSWRVLKRLSGMERSLARGLEEAARKMGGDPGKWFGSFKPVVQAEWVRVQVWEGRWNDLPDVGAGRTGLPVSLCGPAASKSNRIVRFNGLAVGAVRRIRSSQAGREG